MGWGLRKSMSLGGVRFTFSRRGVTTSVGGKGFRFTSGPRGVYVTAGAGGFYYRQRLGGRAARPRVVPAPAPHEIAAPTFHAVESFASASVEQLSDLSQDDFVASLNEWTRRGALQILTFVALAIAVFGAVSAGATSVASELCVYGAIAMMLARFIERRRRRFLLVYDLGPAEAARYERLGQVLAELAASGRLRGVNTVGHHHDWKRNAGATRSLSFGPAALRRSSIPHVVTNLAPWALAIQGMHLFFLPDRILIRSRQRFAALSYQALDCSVDTGPFVWDEPLPGDAQVVGQTWRYVRRDGGPDRRFNGNRQIPIVRTAYVALTSATGMDAVFQTTRIAAAELFAIEARAYARGTHAASAHLDSTLDPAIREALTTLGLGRIPSHRELKAAYRELAIRNHPDKFARASRELRRFAEQRMREINDAHARLVSIAPMRAPADEPSASTSLPPPAVTAPTPAWRSAEAFATAAAMLAFGVAFSGFRSVPPEAAPAPTPVVEAAPVVVATEPTPAARVTGRTTIACPLRDRPSPKATRLLLLPRATELELLERQAGWWRVKDASGVEGWTGPLCWQAAPTRAATRVRKQPRASEPAAEPAPVDPYAGSAATTAALDDTRLIDPEPEPEPATEAETTPAAEPAASR